MSIYSLVNVPRANGKLEIRGYVEGENIYIVAGERGSKWRDGNCVQMTNTFIGNHMLSMPDALRQMYADDIATAIRMGRDAGYAQAKAEIREALGIK